MYALPGFATCSVFSKLISADSRFVFFRRIKIKQKTLAICAQLGFCMLVGSVHAQTYPSKPIKVIVPFAPGGGVDITVRPVMEHMSRAVRQAVVIDNRAGGGGTIGANLVAKSAPDGYTLLIGSSTILSVNPVIMDVPYDPKKDFAAITMIGTQPKVAISNPSSPYKTLREFVAAARARPNQIFYSSSGNGGPGHLGTELFKFRTGIEMVHVPYKGTPPSILAVVTGEAQFSLGSIAPVIGMVKSGKLRALAVSSTTRSKALPDVPTFSEEGFKDMNLNAWTGLFAPAKTPPSIIAFLQKQVHGSLQDPGVVERLAADDVEPVGNAPREFAAFVQNDQQETRELLEKLKIKVD